MANDIRTYSGSASGYSWTGADFQNQIASLISVNEPIIVKEIWCYVGGDGADTTGNNVLWNKDGASIVNTATLTYPAGTRSAGGQSWVGGTVADTYLEAGQYHLGFWADPAVGRVWSQATGTVTDDEYYETATTGIESWGAADDIQIDGAIMAYIVYEPAGRAWINKSGWKQGQAWVNVAGSWKKSKGVWKNINGTWERSK